MRSTSNCILRLWRRTRARVNLNYSSRIETFEVIRQGVRKERLDEPGIRNCCVRGIKEMCIRVELYKWLFSGWLSRSNPDLQQYIESCFTELKHEGKFQQNVGIVLYVFTCYMLEGNSSELFLFLFRLCSYILFAALVFFFCLLCSEKDFSVS